MVEIVRDGFLLRSFTNSYWNGITTLTIAKVINTILNENLFTNKRKVLIELTTKKINKYQLLKIFQKVYSKKIKINKGISGDIGAILKTSPIQKKYFAKIISPIEIQLNELKSFYSK